MKRLILLFILVFTLPITFFAQRPDTLLIKGSDVNTKLLKPGMHRWLVYFKMGKDSSRTRFNIWSRKIDFIQYANRDAISVTQEWEDKDSIFHTVYTVCDGKNFTTFYQSAWWKVAGLTEFDFLKKEMKFNGKVISANDTGRVITRRRLAFEDATTQYTLNWHLDMEVFPLLPYRKNRTFKINYYDPGYSKASLVSYTVTGSRTLTGYDGQTIDCWTLEDNDKDVKNKEVFYISKKTKEVLQLEQKFGDIYRYKVKLPFSN